MDPKIETREGQYVVSDSEVESETYYRSDIVGLTTLLLAWIARPGEKDDPCFNEQGDPDPERVGRIRRRLEDRLRKITSGEWSEVIGFSRLLGGIKED